MSATDWLIVIVGALGFTAIGSFTCVIIDRLPKYSDEPNEFGEHWDTRPWGEVLGGTSRCSDCATPVRPIDNIPVVSYLVLRGRCRGCDARIPAFHPLVEAASPLLFLLFVWTIGLNLWLIPALWLIPVGLAVTAIDLRTLIVPTRVVWPAAAVLVVLSAIVAFVEGHPSVLISALVGVVVFAGPLFVIWFIIPAGMGFGDVRLAVLLGWALGFYAGTRPMAAVVLAVICLAVSSVLGLVIGLVALGARGRKAKVPFGPALILGTYLCIAWAPEILDPFNVYLIG